MSVVGFNTLWIYTALKLISFIFFIPCSFNTLWIYTALKPFLNSSLVLQVSIPSEFTLLSNCLARERLNVQFQYPLNLHCSQTCHFLTKSTNSFNTLWIYTALKPIYFHRNINLCFNTLWIYTALKQVGLNIKLVGVSIPSEFTLLSNK